MVNRSMNDFDPEVEIKRLEAEIKLGCELLVPKECEYCGSDIESTDKFCQYCGIDLKNDKKEGIV